MNAAWNKESSCRDDRRKVKRKTEDARKIRMDENKTKGEKMKQTKGEGEEQKRERREGKRRCRTGLGHYTCLNKDGEKKSKKEDCKNKERRNVRNQQA